MDNRFLVESDVENLALDTLEENGYDVYRSSSPTSPNSTIDSMRENDHSTAILTDVVKNSLRFLNPGYTEDIYQEAMRQLNRLADNHDLMINNKYFHKLLIEGIRVNKKENDINKTQVLYLIDFKDFSKNNFIATNQYTYRGIKERRPDTTIFINGLPLVTFEFKSASDPKVGINDAYMQFQTYKQDIPNYLKYNEILIISDGLNARAGSLTSNLDRFMRWRDESKKSSNNEFELEIMIRNMLNPKDIINLIENFIIFENNGDKIIKIIGAYHQYYMVNKAVKATKKSLNNSNDKRIGVVWHTTGSGKSLSMVFFTSIVARKLHNPTFLVINDRNDLDDQLFDTFSRSHDFLRQEPVHAESKEELRSYINRQSGGIIFSTIQKFSPDFENGESEMPILTNRDDVIVIADEAHRTQYGMEANLTDNGVRYGFAKCLRDALPNASFIGFTGTPISTKDKSTVAVFGKYIDVYDITQSIKDQATVKIYYESHLFPLRIKEDAEENYNELLKINNSTETDKLKINQEISSLSSLAGARPRMKSIASHFVHHFEIRQKESFGKSMIVEMSRRNAVILYNEIIKIRPEWHSDDITKGKIKVVMTSSSSDGPELSKFQTSKSDRRILQRRMKNNNDELKIVIVVDMWLTGFDVPAMNTMYIDKPMKGHNLIQAIARVNRVFKDKDSALIVDYIGIAEELNEALRIYSVEDQSQVGINMEKALLMLKEKYLIIKNDFLYNVDYKNFDSKDGILRMKITRQVANEILDKNESTQNKFLDVVSDLQKLYSLTSTQSEAQNYGKEIAFFKTVKIFIQKLKRTDEMFMLTKNSDLDFQVQQLLNQSVITEPDFDIYDGLGIEKPNIDLISDDFLNYIDNMREKEVAIAVLENILKGKIRSFTKINKIKSEQFGDMLKKSIDEYNNRGITSDAVIRQLIDMVKRFNVENNRGKSLGLRDEEISFFDILSNYNIELSSLSEKDLRLLAKKIFKTVSKEAGTDFRKRKKIQAQVRVAVKNELRKYGYPKEYKNDVAYKIVEQAEYMEFHSVD